MTAGSSHQEVAWHALLTVAAQLGSVPVAPELSFQQREGELVALEGPPSKDCPLMWTKTGGFRWLTDAEPAARQLTDLYGPLCPPDESSFFVAHLGQSLDGCIGPADGRPEAITGSLDMVHNHRMRALFQGVLVGPGTVWHDDPQLNVRRVQGRDPVRVVLDPDRRLESDYRVFQDGLLETWLLCKEGRGDAGRHGQARVIEVPGAWSPQAIASCLSARSLQRIFIEGGGVTVSEFLQAGVLSFLQLAVSPLILGGGRPGLSLGETLRLRPLVQHFQLGEDILFQCDLRASRRESPRAC